MFSPVPVIGVEFQTPPANPEVVFIILVEVAFATGFPIPSHILAVFVQSHAFSTP